MVFELAANPVITNSARHLISPNIHVIVVHFPLGVFVMGLILEVLGLAMWRRSSARVAAKWMILLGGLLAVPATLSGIDAYEDVKDHSSHKVVVDGASIKVGGLDPVSQWEPMRKHILYTSIGSGLAALGVTVFLGLSDGWRRRLYAPILLILLGAAFLMSFGAHFGGEGIYLQGIAVQLKGAPANGFEWWVPTRSTHILIAGLAIAASLGALGASMRQLAYHGATLAEEEAEDELTAFASPQAIPQAVPAPRRVTDDLAMARTLNADAAVTLPRLPSGRFWLLASLLFIITLGLGTWYLISLHSPDLDLSHLTGATVVNRVKFAATRTEKFSENRIGLHILLGIVLVILPLLLAIVVRFMARVRVVVAALCVLMVLVIAAEIWIGVLLSFRGAEGPIYRFPPAETATDATT
ncbi:MAG TPA: hypothetical protein VIM11_05040 [Tepidisphaeraceae bacterium]